jgi:hypothetical protein
MAKVNSYEEQRRRQMEENKRKMDELQLHRLSAAVSQAAAKPMPVRSTLLLFSVAPLLTPSDLLGAADQAGDAAESDAGRPEPAVRPHRKPPKAARLPH